MKICEIEFASSSIAFSMQIVNELELNLFSLEFNYPRTTSLELISVKRVRVKLNFSPTRDVSKFNFSRSRAAVASNIRLVERCANRKNMRFHIPTSALQRRSENPVVKIGSENPVVKYARVEVS